jgi:hypothetical protein
MSFANEWEEKILGHVFGLSAYTAPTIYVGLHKGTKITVDPSDSGGTTVTEPSTSGTNYARVQYPQGSDTWTRTGSTVTNTHDIEFNVATGNWTTGSDEITSVVLYNHATAGELLAWGDVSTAKPIETDDQAKILASQLSITLL